MSPFEFFFTFYGLIMGLAVANAAGGFGAMWRDRHDLRIGWCVPLLSALILFSAVGVWLAAWSSAENPGHQSDRAVRRPRRRRALRLHQRGHVPAGCQRGSA